MSVVASAQILRVAVPSPLRRCFDYLAPPGYDGLLAPGMRVRVSFGPKREETGLVLALPASSAVPPQKLKTVLAVLDEAPLLPPDVLALLAWAQDYYHHAPGEVCATALPVLLRQGEAAQLTLAPRWRLTEAGRQALTEPALARAPRQKALLAYLHEQPDGADDAELRQALPGWTTAARALRDKGCIEKILATPGTTRPQAVPPDLNPAQAAAVTAVQAALGTFRVSLLDGVTGSGKTEVYLRIIEQVLAQGRQALVLVPEIGLTPQLLARFRARLPGPLAVLHSGLTDRERLNAWLLAQRGVATVVIGTRSAIFTPLAQPGVIIVDEEHDPSFKQQDGFRYNARDLAVMRARELAIPVLLGSATPALETLHNAQRHRYGWLQLPERVGGAQPPTFELLDVRRQTLTEGLSEPLLKRMRGHLAHGGQVLLFLNRRGFAPALICHECGWLGQCRDCDARLTLHLRRQRLICHHCGLQQRAPPSCPTCGSIDLRALGQGTERIEQVLQQQFAEYGIARIDRDSTRRKGSLETLLEEIHAGERRVLLGTQMLAKGHHFPDVTLVGIVDADQGLFGTDFRASERMAQLILQVAGRAGRAEKPGTVAIQTHHPAHPLLQTLVTQGYTAFAAATLHERQTAELPPFTYHALLRAEAVQPEPAERFLSEARALSEGLNGGVELLGPVPAPMERRAGRYRMQLLVQAGQRPALHAFLTPWLLRLDALKAYRDVRWSLDVDPLDLL